MWQGNIIALLDNTGNVVVKYTYDAWGNHAITVVDAQCEELGDLNPFRYRGYYYDDETCLYYLKTRYYDPEIGRFITMDSVAYLAPDRINGLNLYAYCGNNPVMRVDSNGTDWNSFWRSFGNWIGGLDSGLRAALGVVVALAGLAIFTLSLPFSSLPFSGYVTQLGVSMAMYGGFMFAAAFNTDVKNDMDAIGWNPFNTDAAVIVGDPANPGDYPGINEVSFYKGVPVVRHHLTKKPSASFGIIFLQDFTAVQDLIYRTNMLNHEWGHTVQFRLLGLVRYAVFIALPSVIFNSLADWDGTTTGFRKDIADHYYDLPWERSADLFGGASNSKNAYSAEISLMYFLLAFMM